MMIREKQATAADALQMYLEGYTFDEIWQIIRVSQDDYIPFIEQDMKHTHKRNRNRRISMQKALFEWNDITGRLKASGYHLGKILIVQK